MHPNYRRAFNQTWNPNTYQQFLDDIALQYNHRPPFRIAESPVFVSDDLKEQLFDACEQITDVIVQPDFTEKSQSAVLHGQTVPDETEHTSFLQMDFGICKTDDGRLVPRLIEAQGFPSLYFYQHLVADMYRKHFSIPAELSHLFGGLSSDDYLQLLRQTIIGDHNPENVILLEIEPEKQATFIDFLACKAMLGINYLCVSDLKVDGGDVFYINEQGKEVQVKKIFNRVIFDELLQRDDLNREFYFTQRHNIEWAGHPHWFFRISKHTLPLLSHIKYVPESTYLNELDDIPDDLHNYVLKPLYSFSGSGVIINLNRYDLDSISDPENYILQRKVTYAPVIETPNVPAKCEIRILMLWEQDTDRPRIVNNLARLSKGEMIGVKYNKDKDWVGGSVGFFKK